MGLISIVSNIRDAQRTLKAVIKQTPFAMSKALNNSAFDLRDEFRNNELPRRFTLRNRFTQRSIRVKYSKKTNLEAGVYSDAYYLKEQAAGMVRTPKGEAFAVPISKQWKNKKRRIPKKIRPDQLMAGGNSFIGKTKGGEPAIVLRSSKKRRRGGRSGKGGKYTTLVTMYSLHTSVRIPRTLDLNGPTIKIIPRVYPEHFRKEMINALRTAKQ